VTEIEQEPPSQGTAGSSIRERPPVAEVRIENVEVKEWRKGKRKRPTEGGKAKHYVYILTDVGGKGHSYVGYTPHLEKRLDEHNAGTGADATRGEQWRYFAVLTGFSDRRTALRFESLMHLHRVTDVREWLSIARSLVGKYAAEFGDVVQMQ
jgi:predicted GIY-YIG superfamily endonuclease